MHKISGNYAYMILPLINSSAFSSLLFTDIVHSCVDHIVNSHFNAFSHLLRAAKDPIEDIFDEQFQKAVEKIRYQFKIEKIVYCQDSLYSDQLSNVKKKPIGLNWLCNADLREMVYHLSSYFKVCIPNK